MQQCYVFTFLCILSCSAHGEVMGQTMARSANPAYAPLNSVEIGASYFTEQLQWQSLRFNLKASNEVILYTDYANVQASNLPLSNTVTAEFAGHGFGAGIVVPIDQRYLVGLDFALNLSTHYALLPQTKTSTPLVLSKRKLLQRQSVIKLLVSPLDPVLENGLSWFATIAYQHGKARVNLPAHAIEYRPTSGFAIGAGLLLPFKYGELYAGFESISRNRLVNVGVRYPL